jgi:hypothetical protein
VITVERSRPAAAAAFELGFHLDPDPPLGGRRPLRRRLVDPARHRFAVVVDVAGQHEARTEALGQVHRGARRRQRLLVPARVDRVDAVHDDVRHRPAAQGIGDGGERCTHELRAGRHAGGGIAADVGEDAPAGGGERLRGGEAEAAVGAEDEDGAGAWGRWRHGDLRSKGGGRWRKSARCKTCLPYLHVHERHTLLHG